MFLTTDVFTVHDTKMTEDPELHTARWSEDVQVG